MQQLPISFIQTLLENIILEVLDDEPAPGCNVKFAKGAKMKLMRAVRVIPLSSGGYFAGEPTGARGRGTTEAYLRPGLECVVIKTMGVNDAWVKFEELDQPVKIHINKFCPSAADAYSAKKALRRGQVPGQDLSPDEEMVTILSTLKKLESQKKLLGDRLKELMASTTTTSSVPDDQWDDKTPVDL